MGKFKDKGVIGALSRKLKKNQKQQSNKRRRDSGKNDAKSER